MKKSFHNEGSNPGIEAQELLGALAGGSIKGMPSNATEWMWWVFSAIVVGVAINLVSPRVGRFLEARIDRYRMRQASNSKAKEDFVMNTLSLIKERPELLSVITYESIDCRARINSVRILVLISFVLAAVFGLSSKVDITIGFLVLTVPIMAIEERLKARYALYDRVIGEYGASNGIQRPPQ